MRVVGTYIRRQLAFKDKIGASSRDVMRRKKAHTKSYVRDDGMNVRRIVVGITRWIHDLYSDSFF